MDDDGFTVQQRRRRVAAREPGRDSFVAENLRYSGRDDDYQKAHGRHYGGEERLGPDGAHYPGAAHFPRGSDREKLHTQYSQSTKPRNEARNAYERGLAAAENQMRGMGRHAQEYYDEHTAGLTPRHHEHLEPRARTYRDVSLENAEGRRSLLKQHPYGYHTADDQRKHHKWAQDAYEDYDYAKERQQHHERYRSYSNYNPKR